MQVPLIQLQCGVNSYEWGKKGTESAAAKFAAATPSTDFSIQEEKPYAEASFREIHFSLPDLYFTNSG
jgi:mannose-6-phosphate isomerase